MSRTAVVLAALLTLAPAARAQEPDERAARLEAENAALRLELRLLRDRMASIDEKLTQLAGRAPWPGAGARGPDAPLPPDGLEASVSEDGSMVLVREARAADDAGASSPEELGTLLVGVLGGPEPERDVDLARLGAFDPRDPAHPFLVPGTLWSKVRPDEGSATPTWDELTVVADALERALRGARVVGLRVADRAPVATPSAREPAPRDGEDLAGARLGVAGRSWTDSSGRAGVKATNLLAGGPAAVGGIQGDDLIQTITCDGVVYPTRTVEELERGLKALAPGSNVTVGIRRSRYTWREFYFDPEATTQSCPVVLGGRAAPAPAPSQPSVSIRASRSLTIDVVGPAGSLTLEVVVVRVNGRWLVASVRTGWFESTARTALGVILGRYRAVRRSALPFADQLTAEALKERLAESGLEARVVAPNALQLPGYRVSLALDLATRDFVAVANPDFARLPALLFGPVTGQVDLSKNPYVVRAAK